MTETKTNKLMESLLKELSIKNILIRIGLFIFFGVMTAFPYVIKNIDKAFVNAVGNLWWEKALSFLSIISISIFKGILIGLSTIADIGLKLLSGDGFLGTGGGTIIYGIFVLIFALFVVYQPVRFILNVFDTHGEEPSRLLVGGVSFMILLLVLIPSSFFFLEGETLTSRIEMTDKIMDDNFNDTLPIIDTSGNIIDFINMNDEVKANETS